MKKCLEDLQRKASGPCGERLGLLSVLEQAESRGNQWQSGASESKHLLFTSREPWKRPCTSQRPTLTATQKSGTKPHVPKRTAKAHMQTYFRKTEFTVCILCFLSLRIIKKGMRQDYSTQIPFFSRLARRAPSTGSWSRDRKLLWQSR